MNKRHFLEVVCVIIAALYLAGIVPSAFGQCCPDPDILCYDLGTLDRVDNIESWPQDINEAGQVVGISCTEFSECNAYFWTRSGGMVDLGTLGGSTSRASQINEAGQVVGDSWTARGELHAIFWTQAGGMVNLGSLGGGFSVPQHINEAGQVAGWSATDPWALHAFFWTQSGGMVDLGTFGGADSGVAHINEVGQVVGGSMTATGEIHAFLWTQSGGMVDLGTLGGRESWAYEINEAGQVIGSSDTATGERHAFLWMSTGGMVDLGTLGGTRSSALYINEAGQVVGHSQTASGENHAFFWTQSGGMVDLGTLGGPESLPIKINEAGQVVGASISATGWNRAFLWTQSGGMVDLGTLGGRESWAYEINEAGQVVGRSWTDTAGEHAFIWTQSGGMIDLGTLGGTRSSAEYINDAGQILGSSTIATGENHATVWSLPPFLDKSTLYFNGTADRVALTSPQTVRVDVRGTTSDTWTVTADQLCLTVSPASGAGNGIFTVSVDRTTFPLTSWDGTIRVSWSGMFNTTRIVRVYGTVFGTGESRPPFGALDTPVNWTAGVTGAIPTTGWALDDTEVQKVEIHRAPVSGEGSNLIYIGEADFVEGTRPDVEGLYPDYPLSYRAGWGYMLLTNLLPSQGNGTHILYSIATDMEGNQSTLGSKTITCDNANATQPFGTIDTPTQGGTASGMYRNWGWALAPQGDIPDDGSTISVWVDGVRVGNVGNGLARDDIQSLFPGYLDTDTAVHFLDIDTTAYANGVHVIHWIVADDAVPANADGLGSRFFQIANTGSSTPDER